ncbi:MAG: DUF362 domain-containing protein [Gemmatimonadetes bacterium]|jgi:uncharacterized protein (DUF362 family)|nr:DUF362 domain-containing protein [Gemmatimonadota bacterium]MBT7862434.1 DUF362 domain-containing protein [Gemmatimonadota bacterium]
MSAGRFVFYRWPILLVVVGSLIGYDLVTANRASPWQDSPVDAVSLATPLENSTVSLLRSDSERLSDPAPADAELTYLQIREMVWLAIEMAPTRTGPLPSIIEPGDWVVVKPNMVFIPPQSGNYSLGDITDPRVTQAVLEYLARFSAAGRITLAMGGSWKGLSGPDFSNDGGFERQNGVNVDGFTTTFGDNYPGFEGSFTDVIDSLAIAHPDMRFDTADFNYDLFPTLEDRRMIPVPESNGIAGFAADEYYVGEALVNADIFISVPTMKVHDIPGVSLSLKNYVGTQSRVVNGTGGWWNAKLHGLPGGIDMVITDLVSYHPPDYVVIGAVWGMEGNGPHISQGGLPLRLNMVLAGQDPVATDAVATKVMGFNPWDIEHLRNSSAKGFGTIDERFITVRGDAIQDVQLTFAKPPLQSMRLDFYYGRANREWLINGVYPGADLAIEHLAAEADLRPLEGEIAGGATWTRINGRGDEIDLKNYWNTQYGSYQSDVVTYAFTYLMSSTEQEGELWIGSSDGIKVWLNGEVIHVNEASGRHRLAEDQIPIRLQAGENRLLLKVKNTLGDYSFSAAIVDEDGDTLPGIRYFPDTPTWVAAVDGSTPSQFDLEANYPNPFNADTIIPFHLAHSGQIRLLIHNNLGQRVATLVDGYRVAGSYRAGWDGRDDAGRRLASGVYIIRLDSQDGIQTHKALLLQ